MASPAAIRLRLEGYARGKIASILQPLSERLLVEQPQDPASFMVRYLIEERSDLRTLVADGTLAVEQEDGRLALPDDDNPLLDRIAELAKKLDVLDRLRRKDHKRAEAGADALKERIAFLERRLDDAGINYDDKEPVSDEMREFLSWEAMQLDESPMDPKDTETFQYRNYSMHPPFTSEHKPIVSSILKPDVWKSLHGAKTGTGFTFSNLIQSGVVGPHLPVGVVLGDDECIAVFGSLIAPMAQAVHGKDLSKEHHASDTSLEGLAPPADEETAAVLAQTVISVTVRASRNITGFPLAAGISDKEREEVLQVMGDAIKSLVKKFGGEISPLKELDPDVEEVIEPLGMLLEEIPDENSLIVLSGCARSWPQDRAIWSDKDRKSVVWVNGQDHVTIIHHNSDGNLFSAWDRFVGAYGAIETSLDSHRRRFASHHAYGFLTSDISVLGCAFSASMLCRVKAECSKEQVVRVCQKYGLRASIAGEHVQEAEGDTCAYEVTSKGTTGRTEAAIMASMANAAEELGRMVQEEVGKEGGGGVEEGGGDGEEEGY